MDKVTTVRDHYEFLGAERKVLKKKQMDRLNEIDQLQLKIKQMERDFVTDKKKIHVLWNERKIIQQDFIWGGDKCWGDACPEEWKEVKGVKNAKKFKQSS